MIIKEITGNLLEEFEKGTIDIMVHGCNCFHIMGAGIAGQIRWAYPEAYEADLETPCGYINKLGKRSVTKIKRTTSQFIINAYTQFKPGANFEYLALIKFLETLNEDFDGASYIFGFPQIGSGIGGGDWSYIKDIINTYTPNLKIVIVYYDNGEKTVGTPKANIEPKAKGLK